MMSFICSCRNKIGVDLHIYLEEDTHHKRKDPGGLLVLRAQMIASLGPAFLWIIMLSPVEWASLNDEEKEMHATIRMSWVSAYAKGSELILSIRLWKLLKDKTEQFGPLLKVFSSNPGTASSCGSVAWT